VKTQVEPMGRTAGENLHESHIRRKNDDSEMTDGEVEMNKARPARLGHYLMKG